MKIVPATPKDAAPLARILKGWIVETDWMPKLHTPDEDRRFLSHLITTQEVTTLRNWRGVQGFLARDAEVVHALYLAPKVRGQGWGKVLLDQAKSRQGRLTLWTFQQNERARAFYAREGFVEVEFTDGQGNDEKLPDLRLEWQRGEA